jgi:hypothetical protein
MAEQQTLLARISSVAAGVRPLSFRNLKNGLWDRKYCMNFQLIKEEI